MEHMFALVRRYALYRISSAFGFSPLSGFTRSGPSLQRTLDMFKGEWTSRVPGYEGGGTAPLFEDERIAELMQVTGGVTDRAILELGPLEGGHAFMLHQAGAASIVSVEANSRAYLRCLAVKETLGLDRWHPRFADLTEWLEGDETRYGLLLASGVLYHMVEPLRVIGAMCARADEVWLWTHYYDEPLLRQLGRLRKFAGRERQEVDGFACTVYRYHYGGALGWKGFCGGSRPYGHWMERQAILDAFAHFGLSHQQILREDPHYVHGPNFCLRLTRG